MSSSPPVPVDVVPPRSRGRRRGREAKSREAVREAVRDLLRERRIDDLMVNEIVQRAQISRPTFYAQFETKYSVVAALVEDVGDDILDVWSPLFDGDGPIEESQLLKLGTMTIQQWRQQGSLFTATIEGFHTDSEIHDAWSDVLDRFTERMVDRLRRAGPCDGDPELLASVLVIMFERALYMAVSNPTSVFGRSDAELAQMLTHVWWKALAPPPPPR